MLEQLGIPALGRQKQADTLGFQARNRRCLNKKWMASEEQHWMLSVGLHTHAPTHSHTTILLNYF